MSSPPGIAAATARRLAVVGSVLFTTMLASCGGGGTAIEDAGKAFLNGNSFSHVGSVTLRSREGTRAFVEATADGRETVVEVVKEGSKWVAEQCVDQFTHEHKSCVATP